MWCGLSWVSVYTTVWRVQLTHAGAAFDANLMMTTSLYTPILSLASLANELNGVDMTAFSSVP